MFRSHILLLLLLLLLLFTHAVREGLLLPSTTHKRTVILSTHGKSHGFGGLLCDVVKRYLEQEHRMLG